MLRVSTSKDFVTHYCFTYIYIRYFQILLYLTSFYFGMFMILEIGLMIFKVKFFPVFSIMFLVLE
jgi:hypothetical protein